MATKTWKGDYPARRQISTAQVTAYDAATTYSLTINGKSISTIAAGSVNATATALAAAWNASTIAEFTRVTASAATDTVTMTGDTAGEPFTVTSAESGGTGTIGDVATGTTATGPNHYDQAANWSPSGVPADADDIIITGTVDILYGLDQSSIDPASVTIPASYTGKIGLLTFNPKGWYEYLTTYLTYASCAILTVGQGAGSGSSRLKINVGSAVACTATVYGTGNPETQALPALLLTGSHASNVLNATGGKIGLAAELGTTTRWPTIRASNTDIVAGSGCTLGGTINQTGGDIKAQTAVTTWVKTGGNSTLQGTATLTTLTQDGAGSHFWESSGTITTATFRGEGAVLDCSRDLRARTLTNGTFTGGGYINDPGKTMTRTNPVTCDPKSLAKMILSTAPFSLQVT